MPGKRLLEPIHPGEILREEFLEPLGISMNALARALGVPPGRISQIVNGKRSISADTALRLGRYFSVSPESWLGLQADYDLRVARRHRGTEIEARVPVRTEPANVGRSRLPSLDSIAGVLAIAEGEEHG